VVGLLDTVETAMVVADRGGRIVLMNARARKLLGLEASAEAGVNVFTELLKTDTKQIFQEIESGEHEVRLETTHGGEKFLASVQWMPEPDWVVVQFQRQQDIQQGPDPATQITVQELLQEREITYF
jgi:PAS domain-containing protein